MLAALHSLTFFTKFSFKARSLLSCSLAGGNDVEVVAVAAGAVVVNIDPAAPALVFAGFGAEKVNGVDV